MIKINIVLFANVTILAYYGQLKRMEDKEQQTLAKKTIHHIQHHRLPYHHHLYIILMLYISCRG